MNRSAFLLSLLFFGFNTFAQEGSYVRYVDIGPDGKTLAFSFQGDIWTSDINGKNAKRLTIHEAYEGNPKWNADGTKIAFSSNRFGNNDIYVIDANGGMPQRITYHSAGDNITDWTKQGDIYFESSRTFRQVEWEPELLQVSGKGGTPSRLIDAFGSEATASQDGKLIAFVRGYCRLEREQYKGSANRDVWVYNTETKKYSQITKFEGQDYHPVWGADGELYFLSARSGVYNIHSIKINADGSPSNDIQQITGEKDMGIRDFDINSNGLVIYQKGTDLYRTGVKGGGANIITPKIKTDYRFDPYEQKSFSDNMEDYDVSPNGKYTVFIVHGDVFITENDKDKSLTVNISNTPARENFAVWLNDSAVIYSSDRDGKYDMFLCTSADKDQANLFKTLKHSTKKITDDARDEHFTSVSPDGKQIAFIRGGRFGENAFIVADISAEGKLGNERTLQKGWSRPGGINWSPDSKWVAFEMEDLTFNSEIYIQKVDGKSEALNVSMHPRGDHSPVWSPDGSKLGFISARNNSDDDIWYVWLRKEDYQKSPTDWEENDGEEKKEDKKDDKDKKDKKDEVEPIQIDIDRIHERLVQLTHLAGNEGNLSISKDGKTFYFNSHAPEKKGSDLYEIQWNKKDIKAVTKGGQSLRDMHLDKEGKYLYANKSGKLVRVKLAGSEVESMSFNAKLTIDFQKELNQVFEEGWRALRDGFYDPEFHGKDWDVLKKTYKPLCMKASTKTDFMFMYNNMLGQLNASHMGLRGRDLEETQTEKTGMLGIDIAPVNGGVKVLRVIPDTPADKEKSKLNEGDVIVSVDQQNVSADKSFWSLMTNTADSKVLLELKDSKGKTREVVIRPVESVRSELYNEWVNDRRELTEKYSNGRLGYLHIQGMNMPSFERFERELTAAGHGKEGIVIDVRYNGGGWTTDYLMAILNVKQHAYTIPRGATKSLDNHKEYRDYYPFAERLPFFAWTKPSIAMCNANSYSNAEIFSHAYKNLGIGTLVGMPSFGAVISTSGVGLMDGSFVRMPFRAWYVKADDKNMEEIPAVPDIILDNSPNAKAMKMDEQLKRSCEELLKQLDQK